MTTETALLRPRIAAATPTHPLGSRARILLSSVFGPYGRDDAYGSRALNPMELYHNQVTRVQGPFSLRMFHRSWGLMLIQANLSAPCTVLDFPTLERFREELREQTYDIVGISSIVSNLDKVRAMCQLVRRSQPHATIVVGGHIANIPDLGRQLVADHVVRGDGVSWFRRFLGEDACQPLRHPLINSGVNTRCLGVAVRDQPGDVAATVIPSVGCPMGCNFCSTSAMFGGKGKFVNFYESGDELFQVMNQLADAMAIRSFFIMDENFLLYRRRALRLLELMQRHNKAWSLYVFSSANALRNYTCEELVALGISWVWMGLEGEESQYHKLRDVETRSLVRELQSHGIRVLGSSIIGLETHGLDNIDRVIEHAVSHATDFHQFMLYTPLPGTALHAELTAAGQVKQPHEFDPADIHGQLVFRHRHPRIPPGREAELMLRAFQRDFAVNGPSVARIVRTTLAGWRRYQRHPDARIRDRFAWEGRALGGASTALVAAARRYYRRDPGQRAAMDALLGELLSEFGWSARCAAALGGPVLHWTMRREERRLARGWSYEPPTFYEVNSAAVRLKRRRHAALCRSVDPAAPAAAPNE